MVNLKSDIVVVNQFTVKDKTTGKGSKGSTPGAYVTRYMARDLATETVTPIRNSSLESFVHRYMLRSSAVDAGVAATAELVGADGSVGTDGPGDTAAAPSLNRRLRSKTPATPALNPQDIDSLLTLEEQEGDPDDPVPGLVESAESQQRAATLRQRRAERRAARAARRQRDRDRRAANLTGSSDEDFTDTDMDPSELKDWFRSAQGKGGLAFGYGDISLSHEKLGEASRDIQRLFDDGHTALKTVLSFTHEYLRQSGVIPADMPAGVPAGGYRGQLDQLKMRRGIMHGLARMERTGGFDDLRYVGVIQVDTEHVHCHLVMVDAGEGVKAHDGTQRGKLTQGSMMMLRRGIDSVMDQQKSVKFLSSAVDFERRNVLSYIKRWAYESMSEQATPQFVLSLLPENKNWWRASSNRREMTRANTLVRQMVTERLGKPGSPMDAAMAKVRAYADGRREREGLTQAQRDQLVDNGREQIIERCINGVYTVLKSVPESEKIKAPPLMTVMGSDVTELSTAVAQKQHGDHDGAGAVEQKVEGVEVSAGSESSANTENMLSAEEFSLRLRSYSSRLEHHTAKREHYRLKAQGWNEANRAGAADESSRVMYDFYRSEEDYHARCQAKYRHFLRFTPPKVDWQGEWSAVEDYGRRLTGLKALRADTSVAKMKDRSAAEALGRDLYGVTGGFELSATGEGARVAREMIDERIERMEASYRERVDELRSRWSMAGASVVLANQDFETDDATESVGVPRRRVLASALGDDEIVVPGTGSAQDGADIYTPGVRVAVSFEPDFDFDEVKGMDLHDMRYEWLVNQPVGQRVRQDYARMAERRRSRVDEASVWMDETGLGEEIVDELGEAYEDIVGMEEMIAELQANGGVLRSGLQDFLDSQRAARAAAAEQVAAEQARAREEQDRDVPEIQKSRRGYTIPVHRQIARRVNAAVDSAVRLPGE